MARQLRYLGLLVLAIAIAALGYFQMFARTAVGPSSTMMILLVLFGILYVVSWGLTAKFQPYANQALLTCMFMLSAIGVLMIARIDRESNTDVATRQLLWMVIALICYDLFIIFMHDYRILRRFSYVSMVVGLALLLSPMLPGLGREIGGARIWIGIGSYQLQPGEFAKLFIAFFFAAYLFNHRDQLAVGGKKILGLQLPRFKDLGPIIIVWLASMGVLVLQSDLGTSLMFFAMFVAMLYVATDRPSWIIIGFIAFAAGCLVAAHLFTHVGYRVEAWLHPLEPAVYNRYPGGSSQLVAGLFGIAAGGLMGTGLGNGYPAITPLANSDFIFASAGEELGLTGLLAILMLYLLIVTMGMLIAMKIKDGFGKLLASGLAFTMAFQVFTVVGGITLVIPLTGLTMPFMAAGGSSVIANYILMALLVVISNSANKPEADVSSDTFQMQAISALKNRKTQETRRTSASRGAHSAHGSHSSRHTSEPMPRTSQFPQSTADSDDESTQIIGPGGDRQ